MMNEKQQQAIALAATIQALGLVHQIATEGYFDEIKARPILKALLNYSPEDVASAYGNDIYALRSGIEQLKKLLSDDLNRDIAQYLLAVITIELKLVRNDNMRHTLQRELARIRTIHTAVDVISNNNDEDENDDEDETLDTASMMASDDDLTNDFFIHEFANLYKSTASQTEPRIMIKGNHQYLQQSANKIRAMLLGALRAAAFYRHNGGKRLDLMMHRKEFVSVLDSLL